MAPQEALTLEGAALVWTSVWWSVVRPLAGQCAAMAAHADAHTPCTTQLLKPKLPAKQAPDQRGSGKLDLAFVIEYGRGKGHT